MTSSPALSRLALVAGWLLGCGVRPGGSTTDAGGTTTTEATTTTTVATPTTGDGPITGAAPSTTGATSTADTGAVDGCLGDADCAPAQCVGPTDEVCSECLPTALQCASDFDCADGDVCIDFPSACGCDIGFTTVCDPACTSSADCDAGGVCNLETGHCLIDPCVGDADCPPLFACVPVLGGDACRRRGCGSDDDCADGVCIDGLCHTGPGTCIPEV